MGGARARRRPYAAWLPVLVLVFGAARSAPAEDAGIALAQAARASVVRIRWRDARFGHVTATRNAIVVRADGLLVMAGPPLAARGTWTARFADGRELPAEVLASDTQTTLSLLRVRAAGLRPLELWRAPAPRERPPQRTRAKEGSKGLETLPTGAREAEAVGGKGGEAKAAAPAAPAAEPRRAAAPAFAPIGLRLTMVTSDGAVAFGVVRSQRRYGTVIDPTTRRPSRTTGLLGANLAVVDEDAGAPFLDPAGRVVGLMVGRKTVVAPEKGEEAARVGLRLRPEPREAVAVPASVIRIVWPLLERFRRVPRAALGVRTLPMDDALRSQLDLETGGHVVRSIEAGSPAAEAGLEQHDVIVGVDGRPIRHGTSLHDVLLPYRPGMSVRLDVFRAGDRVQLDLRLDARR